MQVAQKQEIGDTFNEATNIQGGAGAVVEQGLGLQTNIEGEAFVNNPTRAEVPQGEAFVNNPTRVEVPQVAGQEAMMAETDGSGETISAPAGESQYDVLVALLDATQTQNKLLKQQVSYSRDIKDQV